MSLPIITTCIDNIPYVTLSFNLGTILATPEVTAVIHIQHYVTAASSTTGLHTDSYGSMNLGEGSSGWLALERSRCSFSMVKPTIYSAHSPDSPRFARPLHTSQDKQWCSLKHLLLKTISFGDGEMARGPGFRPPVHTKKPHNCNSSSRGPDVLSWPPWTLHEHGADIHAKLTLTHIK